MKIDKSNSNCKIQEPHNYEYDVNTSSQSSSAHVVRMIGKSKSVLEIGCGPGSIAKILTQQGDCQVTGLELDPIAIEIAKPYCKQVIQADLNSDKWPDLFDGIKKFDVVLAADVLEHLYDPWVTLQRMVPLINQDGYLVISLPNVSHAGIISCLINGDFEYRNKGLLDRTHIRFFGLKNIEDLFAQAKLKIIEVKYVIKKPEKTEFGVSWSRLSRSMQDELMKSEFSQIYQVVIKVVPLNYADKAVSLSPIKIKYKIKSFFESQIYKIKRYIKNFR